MNRSLPPHRARLVLALLFTGAFVMSCAEMLVIGLIDRIALDLDVSLAEVGLFVTANAVGASVGGPLLTTLTPHVDRRLLLLGALGVFVVGNLVPALGAGFVPILVARTIVGAAGGLYVAAGITTATSIVPADRAGRAMAVVISGSAAAGALGVPIGTLLGHAIGWRGAFVAVLAVSALVLLAALVLVPATPVARGPAGSSAARSAFAPRVLAVLAFCTLVFTGIQSALTYLVPLLTRVSGVDPTAVSLFLLIYGVATTVGSAAGGRFADLNAARTLILGSIGVTVSLVVLLVGAANPWLAGIGVLGMGIFGMGMAPSMQHRVVSLAGPGAAVAAALPSSAVNAGIALGPILGGAALVAADLPQTAAVGAAVAAGAVLIAIATRRLRPPTTDPFPHRAAAAHTVHESEV